MQRIAKRPWTLALTMAALPALGWSADPVTPGSIGDTLKPAPSLSAPPVRPDATPRSRSTPTNGSGSEARITVSRFEFTGNRLFNSCDLAAVIADYVGKSISLNELYEAADKVTDFYADHGYTLANVNVPAQTIKDGVVRLEVIEGRIGSVGFEGNRHYSSERLSRFVTHTRPGAIYRGDNLQHDLLTLNALPGLATRAVLKPGVEFGTTDVVVKTQDTKFDGSVSADNYGRSDAGEYRYSATVGVNNLTGYADRLQGLFLHSNTNRLNYGDLSYSVPLLPNGLTLSADYGYAYFSAEIEPPIESAGHNKNVNASLAMPWIRSYSDTFSSSIGWSYTDANADLTGLSISNTNIQLLNLGLSESHAWANGSISQLSSSLRSNFKGYSDSSCNTFQCRDEEARVELNLQHLQPLPYQMQVLTTFDGVFSPNALPDTEKLAIGGPTSIRGFAPSATRGDRGWYGQLTLRRSFTLGPVLVTPRGFGDTGEVWNLDMDSSSPHDSLSSAGVGLDVTYRMLTFRADWSEPLDSKGGAETAGRDDYGRFYGSLSATF